MSDESRTRLLDAISGERIDWHRVEVDPRDVAAVLEARASLQAAIDDLIETQAREMAPLLIRVAEAEARAPLDVERLHDAMKAVEDHGRPLEATDYLAVAATYAALEEPTDD